MSKDYDDEMIAKWMSSPEGLAWEEGVYTDAFDEGFENARALEFFDFPDDETPLPEFEGGDEYGG